MLTPMAHKDTPTSSTHPDQGYSLSRRSEKVLPSAAPLDANLIFLYFTLHGREAFVSGIHVSAGFKQPSLQIPRVSCYSLGHPGYSTMFSN